MADANLKNKNRFDLIELIYTLRQRTADLEREQKSLMYQIGERDKLISSANNIADAVLAVNDVQTAVIRAAKDYLESLQKVMADREERVIDFRAEVRREANGIVKQAEELARDMMRQVIELNDAVDARAKKQAGEIVQKAEEAYRCNQVDCTQMMNEALEEQQVQWNNYRLSAGRMLQNNRELQTMFKVIEMINEAEKEHENDEAE